MSSKYKFSDIEGVYFITSTVVDWIDAHLTDGQVFARDVYWDILLTVFGFARRIKVCKYMYALPD
jgi:hypothetical protein